MKVWRKAMTKQKLVIVGNGMAPGRMLENLFDQGFAMIKEIHQFKAIWEPPFRLSTQLQVTAIR